jgi:transposase
MGKSLSLDIRSRVVLLVNDGYSCREAARRLRISAASAVRIMQRRRRTGSVAPAVQGRPRVSKLDAASGFLKTRLEAVPDITMPELAVELLEVHRIRVTPAMLSRHLIHRLDYTYKKIVDCDGKAAQKGARRAIRVETQASATDAP